VSIETDSERLIAEMYLQVKKLTSEVKELRSLVAGSPTIAEGWSDPATAWQRLQSEGVKSQRGLQKLRLAGAFSETKGEIRNVSGGDRPTWEYNTPKCRKALQRYFSTIKSVG
jgi:hypothetical protein